MVSDGIEIFLVCGPGILFLTSPPTIKELVSNDIVMVHKLYEFSTNNFNQRFSRVFNRERGL